MEHTISIKVSPEGDFEYYPALKRVAEGDTVKWQCASGPFVIMFKETSPFVEGVEAASDQQTPSDPLEVRAGAMGQFPYAVAVYAGGRVFLDCNCPVIVAN